jgi:hypothetical protein
VALSLVVSLLRCFQHPDGRLDTALRGLAAGALVWWAITTATSRARRTQDRRRNPRLNPRLLGKARGDGGRSAG